MPEQDARQSEPAEPASSAPATPRVSGEVSSTSLGATDTPHPDSNMRKAQLPDEPSVATPCFRLASPRIAWS